MNAVSSPTSKIIIAAAVRALALEFRLFITAGIIALPLAGVDNSAADAAALPVGPGFQRPGRSRAWSREKEAATAGSVRCWGFLGHLGELRRRPLDDNPFLGGELPHELGNLTNLECIYLQDTRFDGCLPPPLASLFNELVEGLTIGRFKELVSDRVRAVLTAQGATQDVEAILAYHDETFSPQLLYAPLNQSLANVSRALRMMSLDTFIKPGSTLSNLGNVRLTC